MVDKKYKSIYTGPEIDEAVGKIGSLNISNYYNKAEVDEKLSEKIDADKIGENYYNKVEIDDQGHFESDALPAQVSVGNIKVGTKLAGLSLKTILKMMLYGETLYPEFTAPTFSFISISKLFGIYDVKYNLNGVLKFNQGKIDPAYETSGKRAGLPYRYKIGDAQFDTSDLEYSFNYEIAKLIPGENELQLSVLYNEGEQPTDSAGAPYDKPYPAGEMTEIVKIIGLTASFSGLENGEITEDQFPTELIPIDDKGYEKTGLFGDGDILGYQVTTPDIDDDKNQQIILLPEGVEICGIQSWNVIACGWQWFYGKTAAETVNSGTWIRSDEVVSKEIGGFNVNYCKYKFNTEDYGFMGKNYFRFFIKVKEVE